MADPVVPRPQLGDFVNADLLVAPRQGRTFVKEGGGWKMKEPVKADADDEALRELHDGLAKLRADEFVDKPGDLEKYGLDKPALAALQRRQGSAEPTGRRSRRRAERPGYAKLAGDAVCCSTSADGQARPSTASSLWPALNVPEASKIVVKTADGAGSFALEKGPAG